jgi:hypothetical protein
MSSVSPSEICIIGPELRKETMITDIICSFGFGGVFSPFSGDARGTCEIASHLSIPKHNIRFIHMYFMQFRR